MNNLDSQTANQQQGITQQVNQQAQVAPVNQPVQFSVVQPAQPNPSLFTQEQLNSIISNRINPLNQKISDLTAQLEQANKLSESYLSELTGYKNREVATKQGVPSKFVDFAVFEASKLAINGKSFEDAMKEYVSSNQQLFNVPNNNSQVASSTNTPVEQQTTQGVVNPAQVVNAQIPSNQGYAPQNGVQPTNQNSNTQPIQYGTTGVQNTNSLPVNNNIESQVNEFLKNNHLIK